MQILTSRLSQKSLVGPTIASARLPDYPCTIHILPGFYSPVSMGPSLRATLDFVCPAIEVSVLSACPQKRPCATPTPTHLLPGTLRNNMSLKPSYKNKNIFIWISLSHNSFSPLPQCASSPFLPLKRSLSLSFARAALTHTHSPARLLSFTPMESCQSEITHRKN